MASTPSTTSNTSRTLISVLPRLLRGRTIAAAVVLASTLAFAPALVAAGNNDVGFIDRSAGQPTQLSTAVRMQAPAAPALSSTAAPAPPAIANRSTCRTSSTATPDMSMSIASISYQCPVYSGGQAALDAGEVERETLPALGSALAQRPGQAGTLWLAGHRTSHGGPFAAVPNIADGDLVHVTDATGTFAYVVVGRAHVEVEHDQVVDASGNATSAATIDAILRTDRGGDGAPRLLLQTCDGADARWMIYADLVTT